MTVDVLVVSDTEILIVEEPTVEWVELETGGIEVLEITEVGPQGPPGPAGEDFASDPLAYYILAKA